MDIGDQVEREHDRMVITRHGKPAAVVSGTDDHASLEERLEVASRHKLIDSSETALLSSPQARSRLSVDTGLVTVASQVRGHRPDERICGGVDENREQDVIVSAHSQTLRRRNPSRSGSNSNHTAERQISALRGRRRAGQEND